MPPMWLDPANYAVANRHCVPGCEYARRRIGIRALAESAGAHVKLCLTFSFGMWF